MIEVNNFYLFLFGTYFPNDIKNVLLFASRKHLVPSALLSCYLNLLEKYTVIPMRLAYGSSKVICPSAYD